MTQSTQSPEQTQQTDTSLALAQQLAEQLRIMPNDWHRLKANRRAQAQQHVIAALLYLIKNNSDEALVQLKQAVGWLDRSLSAPPCPTHGRTKSRHQASERVEN
ncbi:MAG: DUF6439 family protein [Cyanobacteria bacterium P01_H01_bin.15]